MPRIAARRANLTAILSAASVIAVLFWIGVVLPYFRFAFDRAHFGPFPDLFWSRRPFVLLHASGGTIALFVGVFQLWLGETRQHLDWHRTLGKLYLFGVALGCLAAYYLASTTPNPAGVVFQTGLLCMATAWAVTTSMAYLAIRRRSIEQHREWMIRSYVVTFSSFVGFRLISFGMLAALHLGTLSERVTIGVWASWALALVIAEPLIQRRKLRLIAGITQQFDKVVA